MRQTKSPQHYILPVLALICLLLVTGCVTPRNWTWQHPQGLGQQELQLTMSSCEQIAQEEVYRYDYFTPYLLPHYPPYGDRYFYRHHRYLYYYPPAYRYDSHRRFLDQQRFFRICMHSKGWQKVLVDETQ